MFELHPKYREFAKVLGTSYWTVRRMVESGIVRKVLYTDCDRIHVDDANRILKDGLTPEEKAQYSEYFASVRKEAAG